jgi:hypothetical protein
MTINSFLSNDNASKIDPDPAWDMIMYAAFISSIIDDLYVYVVIFRSEKDTEGTLVEPAWTTKCENPRFFIQVRKSVDRIVSISSGNCVDPTVTKSFFMLVKPP